MKKLPRINEVLGISSEYKVVKYSRQGHCDVAYLLREARDRQCPRCNKRGHIKGHRWRKVWHTPVRAVPLMLMVNVDRFMCPACKKSWNDKHELIGTASIHMTHDVQDAVLVDLMDKLSVTAISNKNGPSPYLVNCVLDRAIIDNAYLPRTLCIDEFKADTEMGRMSVGIADGDSGTLVEILPYLTSRCLAEFFCEFTPKERGSVKYYCCDMSRMFIKAQRDWFPNAILCIDRFHVVKLVTDAFSEVRRRVQKDEDIPNKLRGEIRISWKLFLTKRPELERIDIEYATKLANQRIAIATTLDLSDEELAAFGYFTPREPRLARVDRLLEIDSNLLAAYKLMHLFRDWSDMAWCAEKRQFLANWIALAMHSGIPEMKRCAKTLKTNREGVLNGYKYNKTNATAEGLNNSIKVMKRISYGYKRFSRLRRRCLLCLGYYRIIKRGIKINGIKTEIN